LLRIVEVRVERVDVDREHGLLLQEAPWVLEGGLRAEGDAEPPRDRRGEQASVIDGSRRAPRGSIVAPCPHRDQRDSIAPATDIEGPAGQALARVQLAGAVKDGGARREALPELVGELLADAPLGGTERLGVPLGRGGVI